METQHQAAAEIDSMMLRIQDARARAGEAAASLRAGHYDPGLIDRIERSERHLNKALQDLLAERPRAA